MPPSDDGAGAPAGDGASFLQRVWRFSRGRGAPLVIAAFTFLVYANGFGAFFVGDDFFHLRRARRMDGLGEIFRMTHWGEWEPMWYLTYWLDYRLWGAWPFGFHVTNTLWLAASAILLYLLVRQVWPEATLGRWAAALLFASHPLHDEAITYLCARGHAVAAAWGLAALRLYARARLGSMSTWWRGALVTAALVCTMLAGMAKEIAMTLPAWVGMLEWGLVGRRPLGGRASGPGASHSLAHGSLRGAAWHGTCRARPSTIPPVVPSGEAYPKGRGRQAGPGAKRLRFP